MYTNDSRVIKNCIDWNQNKLKNAKTVRDRKRYQQNLENLNALLEESNDG